MTKFEEAIWNAQAGVMYSSNPMDFTKATAEVSKKYIEKAYRDAFWEMEMDVNVALAKWLKENGVI